MDGVIARESEINWSEVHFHSAFKTRYMLLNLASVWLFFACVCTWGFGSEQKHDFTIVCVCVCVFLPQWAAVVSTGCNL